MDSNGSQWLSHWMFVQIGADSISADFEPNGSEWQSAIRLLTDSYRVSEKKEEKESTKTVNRIASTVLDTDAPFVIMRAFFNQTRRECVRRFSFRFSFRQLQFENYFQCCSPSGL